MGNVFCVIKKNIPACFCFIETSGDISYCNNPEINLFNLFESLSQHIRNISGNHTFFRAVDCC